MDIRKITVDFNSTNKSELTSWADLSYYLDNAFHDEDENKFFEITLKNLTFDKLYPLGGDTHFEEYNGYLFCEESDFDENPIRMLGSLSALVKFENYDMSDAPSNLMELYGLNVPYLIVPEGVKNIYLYHGLTYISLPSSLEYAEIDDTNPPYFMCSNNSDISLGETIGIVDSNEYKIIIEEDEVILGDILVASSKDTIPDGITTIGDYAFYNCKSLKSIKIPDSVTYIGEQAFAGCSNLKSITLSESLEVICDYAFVWCERLESITLPKSLMSIGQYIFGECYSLEKIYNFSDLDIYNYYGRVYDGFLIEDDIFIRTEKSIYGIKDDFLEELTIPDGITTIRCYAFNEKTIGHLTLNESLETIEQYAFYYTHIDDDIILPKSVKCIEGDAFYCCECNIMVDSESFVEIDWLDSWTSGRRYIIKDEKKLRVSELESIDISGVAHIGDYAFRDCSGLTSIEIPDSVTSIGDGAFYSCTGLTSIEIPESVTYIGSSAFYNCNLSSVIVHDSFAKIAWLDGTSRNKRVLIEGDSTVCIDTLQSYSIPDSVTSIGNYAFCNCKNLTSIVIPESVTSIGISTFYSCSGLTSVEIPDSVTYIGGSAFYNCSGLTSIVIPDSVTYIGGSAFYNCNLLFEVVNLSELIFKKGSTNNGYVAYYAQDIYTTRDFKTKWSESDDFLTYGDSCVALKNNNAKEVVIPEDILFVKNISFYNVSKIYLTNDFAKISWNNTSYQIGKRYIHTEDGDVSIDDIQSYEIPESVTSIGNYAFSGTKLRSVTIPNSVTSIGSYAFKECRNLTSAEIPNSVTYIGGSAFYNCSGLTSIVIPDSVTSIGKYAFYNCSMTSITIPESVTSIDEYAFCDSNNLREVINLSKVNLNNVYINSSCIIYNGMPIDDDVFYRTETSICRVKDTSVSSITIPNNIETLGSYAFRDCNNLTSIEIPNSVTSIGRSAFNGCSGLTSIEIPDSVTSIESATFVGCSGLTSIEIPESVTSIGSYAFESCTGLTEVVIPDSVTFIGDHAFYSCSGLTSIEIPDSVTSIGDCAFQYCHKLTSIEIPDSATVNSASSVISGCSNLNHVIFGKRIRSINDLDSLKSTCLIEAKGCVSLNEIGSFKKIILHDGFSYIRLRSYAQIQDLEVHGNSVDLSAITGGYGNPFVVINFYCKSNIIDVTNSKSPEQYTHGYYSQIYGSINNIFIKPEGSDEYVNVNTLESDDGLILTNDAMSFFTSAKRLNTKSNSVVKSPFIEYSSIININPEYKMSILEAGPQKVNVIENVDLTNENYEMQSFAIAGRKNYHIDASGVYVVDDLDVTPIVEKFNPFCTTKEIKTLKVDSSFNHFDWFNGIKIRKLIMIDPPKSRYSK